MLAHSCHDGCDVHGFAYEHARTHVRTHNDIVIKRGRASCLCESDITLGRHNKLGKSQETEKPREAKNT